MNNDQEKSRLCANRTTLDTETLTNPILTIQQSGSQKEKQAAFFAALFPQTYTTKEASYVVCYTIPTEVGKKPMLFRRFFKQS